MEPKEYMEYSLEDFKQELGNILFKHTSNKELSVERCVELGFKIAEDVLKAACNKVNAIELCTHFVRDRCNSVISKRLDDYRQGIEDTVKAIKQ